MKLRSLAPASWFFALGLFAAGCASSQPAYTPYGSMAEYQSYGYMPYDPAYWWGDPFWMYSPYAYYYGDHDKDCDNTGACRGGHKQPEHKPGTAAAAAAAETGAPAPGSTEARAEAHPGPVRPEPLPAMGFPGMEPAPSFHGFGGFGHAR